MSLNSHTRDKYLSYFLKTPRWWWALASVFFEKLKNKVKRKLFGDSFAKVSGRYNTPERRQILTLAEDISEVSVTARTLMGLPDLEYNVKEISQSASEFTVSLATKQVLLNQDIFRLMSDTSKWLFCILIALAHQDY